MHKSHLYGFEYLIEITLQIRLLIGRRSEVILIKSH